MKYFRIGLIIVLSIFLMVSLLMFLKLDGKVKDYDIGKITEGEEEYGVVLTGSRWKKYGREVIIYSVEEEKEIYRKDFSELNPWKIVIGDVDGDKIDDISVGVYKKSPLHPVMAKRPFIYSFIDGKLEPKWRGSRLSKPFIDYTFFDIDKDGIDEIISIEILQDNKKVINTYKWKGFGFEGFIQSKAFDDIKDLSREEGIIKVQVSEGKDSYFGLLKLEHNELIIERMD